MHVIITAVHKGICGQHLVLVEVNLLLDHKGTGAAVNNVVKINE